MRRKQRGSIFIYVLVMVSAITAVIIATSNVSVTVLENQVRRERTAVARASFLGAVAKLTEDRAAGNLNPDSDVTLRVGDHNWGFHVSNGTLSKTLKLSANASGLGGSYRFEKVIGNRQAPKPYYYAIFSNSSMESPYIITAGASSANGDMYVKGDLTTNGGTNFANGDVEITGNEISAAANLQVSGMKNLSSPVIPFPAISSTVYYNQSLLWGTVSLLPSITGVLFLTSITGEYPVMYVDNNLSLSGTLTGKGTIFVNGNVDIVGNLAYANSSSQVAIIANGSIRIKAAATSVVGYFYATSDLKLEGTSAITHTLTRGSFCANRIIFETPVVAVNDPALFNTVSEGVKMHMPGLWP